MAKDFLACLGMVFLMLLVVLGVGSMAFFYDELGLVNIELPEGIQQSAEEFIPERTVTFKEIGVGKAEWVNPLETIPTSTFTPEPTYTVPPTSTPVPTATPIPPLAPEIYETEVLTILKGFVSALERWLELNESLTNDNTLIDDPNWQADMDSSLETIRSSSREMAEVGPPPPEFSEIDRWLDQINFEADGLQQSYRSALQAQRDGLDSTKQFSEASDHFTKIKEYLYLAVEKMIAAGWTF